MTKVVVTLMNRETGATVTVKRVNRHGGSIILIHQKLLKEYPGYFIRKSANK